MLITTIEQFRAASSINVSNTIDLWIPYICEAEETFIIPVIGRPAYDLIVSIINGTNITVISKEPIEEDPGGIPGTGIIPTPEELQLIFITQLS